MPEYLAPGVFMEEVSSGAPPIAAVGTSTTGMVGATRRGPVSGPPTLVTNYGEFVRAFGGPFDFGAGFDGWRDLPYAARGFFANGGSRLYVSRVAPNTATNATLHLLGGSVTRLRRDVAAGSTTIALASARGLRAGHHIRLVMVRDGLTTSSADLVVESYDRLTQDVAVNAAPALTDDFEARFTTVFTDVGGVAVNGETSVLASPVAPRPASFTLEATSPGSWGLDIEVTTTYRSAGRSVVRHSEVAGGDTVVPVRSVVGFYVGAWVEVSLGMAAGERFYRRIAAIAGGSLVLDGANFAAGDLDPVAPLTETRISTCEFDLSLAWIDPVERTTLSETHSGLTLAEVPGRYYVDRLAGSALATVSIVAGSDTPFAFPVPADGLAQRFDTAGVDAAPGVADVLGTDIGGPNDKTGLLALADVDEIALLAAPGVTDPFVQGAMIDQASRLMDRFVVLDPPGGTAGGPATLDEIQAHAANFDTRYAAIYYPRVVVSDPVTGGSRTVAPSGHVLGVFARVDGTRGVHKAPANEVIRGISALETMVSRGQQEILNPRGINVLRDLSAERRGLRIYGARCLTSEQDWKYINVRRLFILVEESLNEGLQWVVFEPNDQRLWKRVQESVSIFLEGVWHDGALMGAKKAEAFFVTCDRSVMFDDDIANGRLKVEIGMAPVFPAEFVIVRIGQWAGGSSVTEL